MPTMAFLNSKAMLTESVHSQSVRSPQGDVGVESGAGETSSKEKGVLFN